MPHIKNYWDEKDRLFSAGNSTFINYNNYDAQGNRTRKVVEKGNIIETRYYINGYELFRKEVNGSLETERTTINVADDEKVFLRIEQETGQSEVIRYQYDNHLGSACLELDELGQIISYEEYHPFGTTSYRSGRSEVEVSLKRYKYCGKERDEETGLYYYGMRYYAAWICRFVSVDPLQFEYPELTPFQYSNNNPVTMIDLDGAEGVKPEDEKKIKWAERTEKAQEIVLNIRENSEIFDELFNILENSNFLQPLYIEENHNEVQNRIKKVEKDEMAEAKGFYLHSENKIFYSEKFADEETFIEEFFHAFQRRELYGNSRTPSELDAEAKIFVEIVVLEMELNKSEKEINIGHSPEGPIMKTISGGTVENILEVIDSKLYGGQLQGFSFLAEQLKKEGTLEIKSPESQELYKSHLEIFKSHHSGSKSYGGLQRNLKPDAFNKLMKFKN